MELYIRQNKMQRRLISITFVTSLALLGLALAKVHVMPSFVSSSLIFGIYFAFLCMNLTDLKRVQHLQELNIHG